MFATGQKVKFLGVEAVITYIVDNHIEIFYVDALGVIRSQVFNAFSLQYLIEGGQEEN